MEWFWPLAINLSYLIILSALQFESALGKKIINVRDRSFSLLNHSKEDAVNFGTTFMATPKTRITIVLGYNEFYGNSKKVRHNRDSL